MKLRINVLAGFAALCATLAVFGSEHAFAQDEAVETAEESIADSQADGSDADVADDDAVLAEGDEASDASEESVDGEEIDEETTEEAAAPAKDWGRLQPAVDLVEAGGPIIIILGVLSVIGLAIVVVKVAQFWLLRVGDHRFIDKVAAMLEEGKITKALDFVAGRRGVIARVMEAALRGKAIDANEEQLREEVERVAQVKLDGLERGLPLLSLIATVSPLLGLLGTVLGMIDAFQQLEGAGDRVDPAILSGGIWEALLTTAAGLSVAIPCAALFTWLQRAVDVAGQHMENAATRVFTADLYRKPSADSDK